MRKFYKYFFLIFILLVVSCKKESISIENNYLYSLMFTANTYGNTKNCFCDNRSGGMSERSFLLKKLKKESKGYFIFDCGNSISDEQVSVKTLLKLMEYMGYTAYFVDAYEYNEYTDYFNSIPSMTKMDISSFTIVDKNGKEKFKPYIEKNILGKKVLFISITGYSKIPNYYKNIYLKPLKKALEELKSLASQYDKIFLITDYPGIEIKLVKNNIKNILVVFHLDFLTKITDTDWEGGKILSLIPSGKYFWQLSLNQNFDITSHIIHVKEDIGHDKYIDSCLEE